MSDFQGDIKRGQDKRETGDITGTKNVMPDTVTPADDGTLLSRLIDKRPDTIQVQQQREFSMETVDSSTFYAIMDGDETAVRGRLGGATRDLSDTALNMLVKTRHKAEEKEYAETILGRMIAEKQNEDVDQRPGGMLSRFRWYFVFSPDVNEQLDDREAKKRAHKSMLNTYLGLTIGTMIADNYGGSYDTANNHYYDRFGGRYDDHSYEAPDGSVFTAAGLIFDALSNTVTGPDGLNFKFSMDKDPEVESMKDRETMAQHMADIREVASSVAAQKYWNNHGQLIKWKKMAQAGEASEIQAGQTPTDDVPAPVAAVASTDSSFVDMKPEAVTAAAKEMDEDVVYALASAKAQGIDVKQTAQFAKDANKVMGGGLKYLNDPNRAKVYESELQAVDDISSELGEQVGIYSVPGMEKFLNKTAARILDKHASVLNVMDKDSDSAIEASTKALNQFIKLWADTESKYGIEIQGTEMAALLIRNGATVPLAARLVGEADFDSFLESDLGKQLMGERGLEAMRFTKAEIAEMSQEQRDGAYKHMRRAGQTASPEQTHEAGETPDMPKGQSSRFHSMQSGKPLQVAEGLEMIGGVTSDFVLSAVKKIDASSIMALKSSLADKTADHSIVNRGIQQVRKLFSPRPPAP